MKYLCLVYHEEACIDALPDSEYNAIIDEVLEYREELRVSGHFIAASPLQSVLTATTIRVRNGRLTLTDGPFAETKEVVGGFALLQANSKEEAIELVKTFLKVAGDGECELRQLYEPTDYEGEFVPERTDADLRAQWESP